MPRSEEIERDWDKMRKGNRRRGVDEVNKNWIGRRLARVKWRALEFWLPEELNQWKYTHIRSKRGKNTPLGHKQTHTATDVILICAHQANQNDRTKTVYFFVLQVYEAKLDASLPYFLHRIHFKSWFWLEFCWNFFFIRLCHISSDPRFISNGSSHLPIPLISIVDNPIVGIYFQHCH